MRYKVGDTGDEIEIGQYRAINKGALKAGFTLIIYSPGLYPKGDKILDCKHFVGENSQWFVFPQKEVKIDGKKTEYIPLRTFLDKRYFDHLKTAVLNALNNTQAHETRQSNQLPAQSPTDLEDAPF